MSWTSSASWRSAGQGCDNRSTQTQAVKITWRPFDRCFKLLCLHPAASHGCGCSDSQGGIYKEGKRDGYSWKGRTDDRFRGLEWQCHWCFHQRGRFARCVLHYRHWVQSLHNYTKYPNPHFFGTRLYYFANYCTPVIIFTVLFLSLSEMDRLFCTVW